MLFLHELKQVLVLVKQFSFIIRNVSLKQILLTWFNIFPFSRLQREESSQSGPPTKLRHQLVSCCSGLRDSLLYVTTIYHSQWRNSRGTEGRIALWQAKWYIQSPT